VLCCVVLCCIVLCCVVMFCVVPCYTVLYCAVLCYIVLCCDVLCCTELCWVVLCYAVLCCAMLCCPVLCYVVSVLSCAVLCCVVLCCAVSCCVILYCAVLCCAVLYCAELCCAVLCYVVLYCAAVLCCAVLCCAEEYESTPREQYLVTDYHGLDRDRRGNVLINAAVSPPSLLNEDPSASVCPSHMVVVPSPWFLFILFENHHLLCSCCALYPSLVGVQVFDANTRMPPHLMPPSPVCSEEGVIYACQLPSRDVYAHTFQCSARTLLVLCSVLERVCPPRCCDAQYLYLTCLTLYTFCTSQLTVANGMAAVAPASAPAEARPASPGAGASGYYLAVGAGAWHVAAANTRAVRTIITHSAAPP
jgi:hypothetical protein